VTGGATVGQTAAPLASRELPTANGRQGRPTAHSPADKVWLSRDKIGRLARLAAKSC